MSLFTFIKFSSTTAGTQRISHVFFPTVPQRHSNFLFLPSMPTSGMWSEGLVWHPLFVDFTTIALCRLTTYPHLQSARPRAHLWCGHTTEVDGAGSVINTWDSWVASDCLDNREACQQSRAHLSPTASNTRNKVIIPWYPFSSTPEVPRQCPVASILAAAGQM